MPSALAQGNSCDEMLAVLRWAKLTAQEGPSNTRMVRRVITLVRLTMIISSVTQSCGSSTTSIPTLPNRSNGTAIHWGAALLPHSTHAMICPQMHWQWPTSLANIWLPEDKSQRRSPSLMECVFCKNNNELPEFYKSHILKDPNANIQCPVLRAYNCPICNNGGGPKAHTVRYCPLNKAGLSNSRLINIWLSQSKASSPSANDTLFHTKLNTGKQWQTKLSLSLNSTLRADAESYHPRTRVVGNELMSCIVQTRSRRRQPSIMECVFCKNNNERPEFYKSHILKDPDANIQCPVLRAYNCPICNNGGGPKAHTIRYCPMNKSGQKEKIEKFAKVKSVGVDCKEKVDPPKNFVPKRNRKYPKRDKSQWSHAILSTDLSFTQ